MARLSKVMFTCLVWSRHQTRGGVATAASSVQGTWNGKFIQLSRSNARRSAIRDIEMKSNSNILVRQRWVGGLRQDDTAQSDFQKHWNKIQIFDNWGHDVFLHAPWPIFRFENGSGNEISCGGKLNALRNALNLSCYQATCLRKSGRRGSPSFLQDESSVMLTNGC